MVQFQAILDSVRINKDRSVTIKIETRELTPDEVSSISELCNMEAWVGMSAIQIVKLDIPEEISEFKGEKTPSERLRNILYIYWKEVMKSQGDFETFRKNYMEKIINNIKEKLPTQ